jgi:hypothetical protein
MKNDSSGDEDRTEWDTIWRNRSLRQLVTPVQVDVLPTPNVMADVKRSPAQLRFPTNDAGEQALGGSV